MTSPSRSLDNLAGRTLVDKYRLLELIGAGGMGYVYLAEQLPLGRSVAVKLLRPELMTAGEQWFANEAKAASRINHPHAVSIIDFGTTPDGLSFLVMERLRGRSLADILEDGPLPIPRVAGIASQILSALTDAHDCGVIHCDLSSDNVIVDNLRNGDDLTKVIDFGLARMMGDRGHSDQVVGTPEYLAPEQLRGEPLGPGADLYAVGVLLYEMIVGRTPFSGSSVQVILEGHLHATPVPPHEIVPDCPAMLGALVLWALDKRPERRPGSAAEMRMHLLDAVAAGRPCPHCADRGSWSDRFCTTCGAPTQQRRALTPTPALAQGSTPLNRTSRISLELSRPSRTELVGRETELERLLAVCRGDTDLRNLAIVGAAGAGKARLLIEAKRALDRQVPVFVTGPDPSGARRAWYPVLTLLEAVMDLSSEATIEQLARAVAHTGLPDRDVPGLAEVFGIDGPARVLELAVRRRESQAAALRALLSIRRRFPRAVLGFVDIDQYDQPSRRLIAALVEASAETGIRVVVTAEREVDVPTGCTPLALSGLPAAACGRLAHALTSDAARLPDDDELLAITGGSPVAIEQVVGWIELGAAVSTAPSLLVDLVSSRVNNMPQAPRRVLQATAVHGNTAPRWLVEATLPDPTALTIAGNGYTGLLRIDDQQVSIPSRLARDVISACTPADVSRGMHARALVALEGTAPPAVVGHHAERAGDLARAYSAYLSAGSEAVARFDDVGGAHWYQRALSVARVCDSLGDPQGGPRAIEAILRLADVLRFSGKVRLASGALEEAELFGPDELQRARLRGAAGRVAMSANSLEEAVTVLRDAVGAAVRQGDADLICQSYIDLARALSRADRGAEAIDELEQAVDVITKGQGMPTRDAPIQLWALGMLLSEAQLAGGDIAAARKTAERSLNQALSTGSARGRARLSALLAKIYEAAGEQGAAMRHRANAIDEMRTLGDRRSTAELLIDSASLTREDATPIPSADWTSNPTRSLKIAGRLAREIGWHEGIMLSKRARTDSDS